MQYPEGTTMVYSNFTPRSNKYAYPDSKEIVVFGIQYFIKEYLINQWNEGFFKQPKDQVVSRYTALMDRALGPGAIESQHIADLHDLGYITRVYCSSHSLPRTDDFLDHPLHPRFYRRPQA